MANAFRVGSTTATCARTHARRVGLAAVIACAFIAAPSAMARDSVATSSAVPAQPGTVIQVPREDEWWQARHAITLKRVQNGPTDLIFIGDSITQGWEEQGKEIWAQRYAPRHATNLGYSGDQTQQVLWRLQHGEIDFAGNDPRLAVVMIGTNNSNGDDYTADEIATGIEAIVARLRAELPQTKILLLAIFPRGEGPSPQRAKNAAASARAAKLADGKFIHYLDIGPKFLAANGTLSQAIMHDLLHLSPLGYQIWADSIEPTVATLMAEPTAGQSVSAAAR